MGGFGGFGVRDGVLLMTLFVKLAHFSHCFTVLKFGQNSQPLNEVS